MFSALLSYLDLIFLIGAWLSQWGSILTQASWAAEAHFERDAAAAPPFGYVTVFVGLVGVAVTNRLGARYRSRFMRRRDNCIAILSRGSARIRRCVSREVYVYAVRFVYHGEWPPPPAPVERQRASGQLPEES
ncbi:unnamed protein product [Prorocentrum cordatum]|uniref:Uncharacterized protein n=1 Tax=Prorocentrum cordatum TaxID=2364126 RepID=A0ABN9R8V4_9DINO|nr:unnamed protein product [Polarella glacialis]